MTIQRRHTQQRAAIAELLSDVGRMASAQDLHAQLRATGSTIGLATVYRTLQDLTGSGELDSVRNENGEVLYRRCERPAHHHHLVCRSCGKTEEVTAVGVERWASTTAEKFGYVDVEHRVELFGVCQPCASGSSGRTK